MGVDKNDIPDINYVSLHVLAPFASHTQTHKDWMKMSARERESERVKERE